ncbi:DNA excision repair protein ERCC-5, partial [Phenoliferia sp. Uapishka_3]
MGVNGLWKLVGPVARPIALETLAGRRLAIDASIWMYQFQMAMRDRKTGDPLQGAHIMGTFRRIMKLLFHGIKPVFVFDGDAPMLKKKTIAERKRRKAGATRDLAKTAQQLLSAQLRAAAATNAINKEKSQQKKGKGKEKAIIEEENSGDEIDSNAVYLDDLDPDAPSRQRKVSAPVLPEAPISPKKYIPRDQYALPSIEGSLESRAKASDPRIATEAELRDFIEEMRPEDFDIDSEFFGNLPINVKYEIIGDLRVKSRQVNHKRVDNMKKAVTPLDFSKAQITNLMQRNTLTQKLFSVTDALGQSSIAIPTRVAGERNREYLLVKQDADKGGGWVLGVRDPKRMGNEEIVIDDTTDESVIGTTDSDEFDEVAIPKGKKSRSASPDVETRRALAIEAIRARYAPSQAPLSIPDPYLDQPTKNSTGSLFMPAGGGTTIDEELDPDLQAAIMASVNTAAVEESDSSVAWLNQTLFGGDVAGKETREAPTATSTLFAADPGQDSDDSLEYVDGIEDDQVPPPLPPPIAHPAAASTAAVPPLSDSDDSDEFEEVHLAVAPKALSSKGIDISIPARLLPSRPILPPSAPTLSTPTPAAPDAPNFNRTSAPPLSARTDAIELSDSGSEPEMEAVLLQRQPSNSNYMSIMESILPSDSDSDHEVEAVDTSPPKARPPPPISPIRPVISRDFAEPESAPNPVAFTSTKEVKNDGLESSLGMEDDGELPVFKRRRKRSRSPEAVEPSRPAPPPPFAQHYEDQVEEDYQPVAGDVVMIPAAETLGPPAFIGKRKRTKSPEVRQPSPLAFFAEPVSEEVPVQSNLEVEEEQDSTGGNEDPAAEDEEDFFSDWEKSPTPPPQRDTTQRPLFEPPDPFDEEPDFEDEDEEVMRNLEREGDNYANMISQLKNRKLDEMRQEAEAEVTRLRTQKNADQRNSDGVTRQMALDIKDLLALFGIPYVDAPQEAEAECAELLQRHLVDGIVTDDSDVFLFGGSRIYRNMFNDNKYVECYLLSDLERELGLGRSSLVDLAFLLGGDYAEGLPGVGPVSARELLEDFSGEKPLDRFKEWWMMVQNGKDSPEDTSTTFRRKFKKGHKNLVLDAKWPDPVIARAYYHPVVNQDDTAFSWGGPDLDGLRTYLGNTLSWASAKTDEALLPLIRRQNQRKEGTFKIQASLGDYFDMSAGNGPLAPREKRVGYGSARLQNVVQSFRKNQKQLQVGEEPPSDDDDVLLPAPLKRPAPKRKTSTKKSQVSTSTATALAATPLGDDDAPAARPAPQPKKKSPTRAPSKRKAAASRAPAKSTAASRRRVAKERRDQRAVERGGVYSSEEEAVLPRVSRPRAATKKRSAAVNEAENGEGEEEEEAVRVPSAAMIRKRIRQAEESDDE